MKIGSGYQRMENKVDEEKKAHVQAGHFGGEKAMSLRNFRDGKEKKLSSRANAIRSEI